MKRTLPWLFALVVAAISTTARAETTITVASFPSFDESVKAALPLWEKKHPDIKIKLQSLAEAKGALEDLGRPPYDGKSLLPGHIIP